MSPMKFFQDIADDYYSAGLHHLNKVRAVHDSQRVKDIYDYIAINLRPGKIEDKEDLISYMKKFKPLQEVIGRLYEARPQNSCDWFLPLLKECYSASGIDCGERRIFTVPNVMPRDYQIAYGALRDRQAPTVDVFIIPYMADFDLGSIAMVGHEVGHILIEKYEARVREIIKTHLHDFTGTGVSLLIKDEEERKKLDSRVTCMANHVNEYFCDMIGSRLFGPIFDLSFLRIFLTESDLNPTVAHPAIIYRMQLALSRLLDSESQNSSLNKILTYLKTTMSDLCQKCSSYTPTGDEVKLQRLASKIFYTSFRDVIRQIDLDKAWEKVVPELNGFRPPCETVNSDHPVPITPREMVIGSSLYYYGNVYESNDYYRKSKLNEDQKKKIIKQTLSRHINYAIEIYDFVRASHVDLCEKCKEKLSAALCGTLWQFRSKERNQLIVVPTISPKDQYSRNAIDLRLGSHFLVNKLPLFTNVQPKNFHNNEAEQIAFEFGMFDPVHIPIGKDFILHPHQFVLACTLEYVCLPIDKYAFVLGRSTWGRLGLNIATATTVQPGFRGCLTLELRNLGETPLPLTVGTRIAQIAVVSVPDGVTDEVANDGGGYFSTASKYIGPVGVGLPKIHKDHDWDIIAKFTDK